MGSADGAEGAHLITRAQSQRPRLDAWIRLAGRNDHLWAFSIVGLPCREPTALGDPPDLSAATRQAGLNSAHTLLIVGMMGVFRGLPRDRDCFEAPFLVQPRL